MFHKKMEFFKTGRGITGTSRKSLKIIHMWIKK